MYHKFATIQDVKEKIEELKGKDVHFRINKGRNKIVELQAEVTQVYPSMFIIKPTTRVDLDKTSYSYSDVLCGDIKF